MSTDRKPGGLSRPSSGKHAAVAARALPALAPGLSDETPSSDDDDSSGLWDEHTPILDMTGLYKKVGQTAAMSKVLITKLPQLEAKVDVAIGAAKNAQREAFDAKTEATLAKERIEDVRKRVETLEPLKVTEAETKLKVNGLTSQITAGSGKRRWLTGIIIGLLTVLLGSAGSAIWWASQVDAGVRHESAVRESYDRSIVEKLDTRPTRDEVLTRNELKALRDELIKQRQPTAGEWFNGLTPAEQKTIKRLTGDDPTALQ